MLPLSACPFFFLYQLLFFLLSILLAFVVRFPDRQVFILERMHVRLFFRRFVSIPQQVQHSVDDYACELVFERYAECLRIGTHGIDADHQVARNNLFFRIRVIERDDVSILIVRQVSPVDFQQCRVRAEDYCNISGAMALRLRCAAYPVGRFSASTEAERAILRLVLYGHSGVIFISF